MENLYTPTEAADLLGLKGRSAIGYRLNSLKKRGLALSVEAGELRMIGKRLLITEQGITRLREFVSAKNGRPSKTILQVVDNNTNKVLDVRTE